MAHAGCHRIFGRDAGSAAFHSKSLITFKETRIKNHRYFLTHNSCTKQTLCRLHENSSDWCIASPCLKEEYILLPSSLISEVNMPCSFNMLVFVLLTVKLEESFISIYILLKVNTKFSTWNFLLLFWWEGLCDFPLLIICFQDHSPICIFLLPSQNYFVESSNTEVSYTLVHLYYIQKSWVYISEWD